MDGEITSGTMQKLLGVNKVALNDLAKRGIVQRGERKGPYRLTEMVSACCAAFAQPHVPTSMAMKPQSLR